jgi:fructose-1,6-bisphosphatase/inositol monophosphatase family enzyme
MYYPDNRQRLARAFAGEKGWLRSCGSAAYEMALVASGTAVAFVCGSQKQHELGAGYALVKGAGGVAVDWDGRDLGVRTYDFKTQTPVVLACNMAIADQILERLHRE